MSDSNQSDKKKILIIEDEEVIIDLLSMVLEESGDFCVATALNGKIGFEKYKEFQPDLILLDLQMPVMDGLTFLRQFRRTNTTTPVVIVSSCWQVGCEEALQLGANAWVNKPFRLDELMSTIRDTLAKASRDLTVHRLPRRTVSFSCSQCDEPVSINQKPSSQKRVAVIQHNKETLEVLSSFLRKQGYEVSAISQDEIQWAELPREEYDLIILSVDMFNYDNLTKLSKNTPVIVNTANNDEKARKVGFVFGADAWIRMPFDFSELNDIIESLIGKTPQELESIRMQRMVAFIQDSAIATTSTGDKPA